MTPPNNLSKREHVITYGKVSNFIERLTRQIAKCFEFYLERCYGTPISKIFIIGGGSQLSGLNQYLFSILNLKGLINAVGISVFLANSSFCSLEFLFLLSYFVFHQIKQINI